MSLSPRKCSLKTVPPGIGVHPQHGPAPAGGTWGLVHPGETLPAASDPGTHTWGGVNYVVHVL